MRTYLVEITYISFAGGPNANRKRRYVLVNYDGFWGDLRNHVEAQAQERIPYLDEIRIGDMKYLGDLADWR